MTPKDQARLSDLAQSWKVTVCEKLDETGIAFVYRTIRADGTDTALKLYKNGDPKNEAMGFEVLQHWNGTGAAYVYESAPDALLLEYLSGPSLGDLSRSDKDDGTAHVIAAVARQLRTAAPMDCPNLPTLDTWYADLLNFDLQKVNADLRGSFEHAIQIARGLLATQGPQTVLHGDLHHDNILKGDRGWLCIDPKGVIGEAEAEMANTYRNPKGGDAYIVSADRLRAMNRVFATELGLDAKRLFGWGTAKTALSAVWQINAGLKTGPLPVLLPLMLELLDQPLS